MGPATSVLMESIHSDFLFQPLFCEFTPPSETKQKTDCDQEPRRTVNSSRCDTTSPHSVPATQSRTRTRASNATIQENSDTPHPEIAAHQKHRYATRRSQRRAGMQKGCRTRAPPPPPCLLTLTSNLLPRKEHKSFLANYLTGTGTPREARPSG